MKKSERIEILEDKVDDLGRTIAGLKALFDETRQTVFALTDKLDAEEANETLAADMAKHVDKIILDDLIDQNAQPNNPDVVKWFTKTKANLTAEDIVTATKKLAELPDDYDFPTDEDLERIDQLMDQLARDHE